MIFPLILLLFSSSICIYTARTIRNDRVKIRDPLHLYLPYIDYKYLSDILLLLQTIVLVWNIPWRELGEFFTIVGVSQFFRAITMSSTILPPLKHFNKEYRFGGLNGTGTEYIYSGHAVYACLGTIYLYRLDIFSFWSLFGYNLVSQLAVILTHNHYTVDVVLSWIITPLLYSNLNFCKQVEWCAQPLSAFIGI